MITTYSRTYETITFIRPLVQNNLNSLSVPWTIVEGGKNPADHVTAK
jgi:hypothetical protein